MPSGWGWVIAAVAVLCLFCAAMAAYHALRIRVTYAWVQVFGRRFEWRRGHRKNCACDDVCWPAYVQRLRDVAARQAAEINQQEKQR